MNKNVGGITGDRVFIGTDRCDNVWGTIHNIDTQCNEGYGENGIKN